MNKKRLAILISGRGSNMVALNDAILSGSVADAEIVLVLSDKANAGGLVSAQERGLQTAVVERRGRKREEHESEVLATLSEYGVEIVCLAGYMRLLSASFIASFQGRILNIHPSLLPAFPGLDAQRQALEHGVKVSGCTVHFVNDTLDGGPIVAQRTVAVFEDDSEATLSARILDEEHLLYAEALRVVLSDDYEVVGRRVVVHRRDAEA